MELQPACTFSFGQLADLFNAAFTGYIGGDAHFTAATLAHYVAGENIDLSLSQVVVRDDQPVGFGYVARQGWTSRLAAFGIVAAASHQGVGQATMTRMIAQARERGDHLYELEAVEGNTRAVRLYQGVGFEILRRLVGYKGTPDTSPGAALPPDLQSIDIAEVARQIAWHGASDLPWDLAGTSIAHQAPPSAAFALDGAFAVVSNLEAATVVLQALIVPPDLRRHGRAERLLRALFVRFPGKTWRVPVICPEETGAELAARLGFERLALTQFQMRLTL